MKRIFVVDSRPEILRTRVFINSVLELYTEFSLDVITPFRGNVSIKRNILLRLFNQISKYCRYFIDLLSTFYFILKADYIYFPALTFSHFVSRFSFLIANAFRKKIIFDFFISYYDTSVLDRKELSPKCRKAKYYKYLDKLSLLSYRVIYLTQTEASRYPKLFGVKESIINGVIIPLTIKERTKASLDFYKGKSDCFNIMWWGTYIPLHGLDRVIQSIQQIVNVNKQVHLYIFGTSEIASLPYRQMVEKYGLEEYITIDDTKSFNSGQLEPFIAAHCDLALGAFGDSDKARTVILHKSVEAIAMKIPVMVQGPGGYVDVFSEDVLFYTSNDVKSMSETVLDIMKVSEHEIMDKVEKAYAIYTDNFSPENSSVLYKQLLKKL